MKLWNVSIWLTGVDLRGHGMAAYQFTVPAAGGREAAVTGLWWMRTLIPAARRRKGNWQGGPIAGANLSVWILEDDRPLDQQGRLEFVTQLDPEWNMGELRDKLSLGKGV